MPYNDFRLPSPSGAQVTWNGPLNKWGNPIIQGYNGPTGSGKMGGVQNYYDLQDKRQFGENPLGPIGPVIPSVVNRTWTNSSVGTTQNSRPATEWEKALLPEPDRAWELPRPKPGFTGTLPQRRLKGNRYGWGESNVPPFGIASRAFGGPLESGQTSYVGELGPEMIRPQDGTGARQIVGLRGPEVVTPQEPVQVVPMTQSTGDIPVDAPPAPRREDYNFSPLPIYDPARAAFNDTGIQPQPDIKPMGAPGAWGVMPRNPIPADFPDDPQFKLPSGKTREEFEAQKKRYAGGRYMPPDLADDYEAIHINNFSKWKMAEADRKAAADAAKFQATQAGLNARVEFTQQEAAKRQAAGHAFQGDQKAQAAAEKQAAEDIAYADAVAKVRNRWEAGLITPEEMVRFEGLQTSKAVQAELDHLQKQRDEKTKAERPPVITDLPTDRPVAVGGGASPRISDPSGKMKKEIIRVQQVVDNGMGGTKTMDVPHYMEYDEAGKPYLVPVPVGKPGTPAAPTAPPPLNTNDFINGALKKGTPPPEAPPAAQEETLQQAHERMSKAFR